MLEIAYKFLCAVSKISQSSKIVLDPQQCICNLHKKLPAEPTYESCIVTLLKHHDELLVLQCRQIEVIKLPLNKKAHKLGLACL